MKVSEKYWLAFSAIGALLGALLHVAAIFGGPSWYAFLRAPHEVVASATAGTWLAPVGALVIAGLMLICSLYAFSAAGYIRRLPLLRLGLGTIAFICLVRGLLLIPFIFLHPKHVDTFGVVGSSIWFLIGVGFAVGFRATSAGSNYAIKGTSA